MAAVLIVWAAGLPAFLLMFSSITSRRRERAGRADQAASPQLATLPLLSHQALLSARPGPGAPRRARTPGCR